MRVLYFPLVIQRVGSLRQHRSFESIQVVDVEDL